MGCLKRPPADVLTLAPSYEARVTAFYYRLSLIGKSLSRNLAGVQAEYPKTPRKVCWLFLWESDSRDKVIRQEEVEEMMSQPGHSP